MKLKIKSFMPKIEAYDSHATEYDAWFEENNPLYLSELQAVRKLLPQTGIGVEIGVGTGRFAQPLGIKIGVEPSQPMRVMAEKRGITVYNAVAEALPLNNEQFDYVLMVTTICFLDDVEKAFKEAYRVLKQKGSLVVAFIDKNSPLGKLYEQKKQSSVFYKDATFYTVNEVVDYLKRARFNDFSFTQTIFPETDNSQDIQPAREGYDEGSFIVARGMK